MKRPTTGMILGIAGAIGLLWLLVYGMGRDPYVLPSPLEAKPAPGFTLPVMPPQDGADDAAPPDTLRLSDLRGSVVVMNFWASWCLACREEHPVLVRAARRYEGHGVRFVGVLFQDKPPDARRFLRELGQTGYPNLMDRETHVAIDYGVYGVPETFFLDRTGRVAHKHIGPVTDSLMKAVVDSLLSDPGTGARQP